MDEERQRRGHGQLVEREDAVATMMGRIEFYNKGNLSTMHSLGNCWIPSW